MAVSFILPLGATRAQEPATPAGSPSAGAPVAPAPPTATLAASEIDATLTQAQMLLKLGDLEGSEAGLRRILAVAPGHLGALTTLRRVLIDAHRKAALPDVLARSAWRISRPASVIWARRDSTS